jgi:hypothetical protein
MVVLVLRLALVSCSSAVVMAAFLEDWSIVKGRPRQELFNIAQLGNLNVPQRIPMWRKRFGFP